MSVYSLFLVLALNSTANAEPIWNLNAKAASLISAAKADVQSLKANSKNCTKNHERLQTYFLSPSLDDLESFSKILSQNFGAYIASNGTCARPSQAALQAGIDGAKKIVTAIDEKLAQATQPQARLFFKSGDQTMDEALSAAPEYPNCKAENVKDPLSTKELKTYYAMKEKFRSLGVIAGKLGEESENLIRGKGNPVCRN